MHIKHQMQSRKLQSNTVDLQITYSQIHNINNRRQSLNGQLLLSLYPYYRRMQDKKFKPQSKPFKENKVSSMYRVTDEQNKKYYAKFFMEKKMQELNIFQSSEYNQTVLSDLSDQIYPEHFLQIKHTYSIPGGFIFVTEPYENTLDVYLKGKVIDEAQALQIFQQVIRTVYSLHMAGFWHRNIRPQHFVKVGNTWKMESLVFSEQYKDANGMQSQYLWNPAYQPPEAYGRQRIPENELDEMIVWNLGSLLLDLLLSYHKLKDLNILSKYKDQPFSFKAIGVKKNFSEDITNLLSKMLHHNPSKRTKVAELFSNQFVSKTVAKEFKKGQSRKPRIYLSGTSQLSYSLSQNQQRAQQILTIKQFTQQKQRKDQQYRQSLTLKDQQKLQSGNEMLNIIKRLAVQQNETMNLRPISEQMSSLSSSRAQQMSVLLANGQLSQAVEAYKCSYDKSELLIIATAKFQKIKYSQNVQQAILLNKYAITFVALMNLNILAESMNRNINSLELDGDLWSIFQASKEFRGFKQIINHRRNERKDLLNPLRDKILKLKQQNKNLMKDPRVEEFIHRDYFNTQFQDIKKPYRKIVKSSYDIVTKEYNNNKTEELASIGMYVTYCLVVDKFYIKEEIQDNFRHYFNWSNIHRSSYVPLDEFQDYLDRADKKTLVAHNIHILKKYFNV